MQPEQPQPPFRVEFRYDPPDADTLYDSGDELATDQEFFDSDDPDYRVWDGLDRPVHVKAWATELKLLELYEDPPAHYTDPSWRVTTPARQKPGCALLGSGMAIGFVLAWVAFASLS
ncbi:MAG: hypothetical protein AMXMBFR61_09720 [Fimbriimonadales bacterium]